MEKIKEKMPQLVKNATVREEILQGMITSFQLEGIKISQETAYTILERMIRSLKCVSDNPLHSGVVFSCYLLNSDYIFIKINPFKV